MAKNNYETQLSKAVLQIMNGCSAVATIFMNHKVDPIHKNDVSEGIQARVRELKKQMEYTPPEEQFSLTSLSSDADGKKQSSVKHDSAGEPQRPSGLGGTEHTHGSHN